MNHPEHFDRFLSDIYPCIMVRGQRIERIGSKPMDTLLLDAETAGFLGSENVGVLVEDCGDLPRIRKKLGMLDDSPGDGRWIAIMGTRTRYWAMYHLWQGLEGRNSIKDANLPPFWCTDKLVFVTPEDLQHALREVNEKEWQICGIILVDLDGQLYKSRGHKEMRNDRPQRIVDFRAALTTFGWAPPLIIMTQKLARSINTTSMREAYCLEAWWYVNGNSISFKARENADDW